MSTITISSTWLLQSLTFCKTVNFTPQHAHLYSFQLFFPETPWILEKNVQISSQTRSARPESGSSQQTVTTVFDPPWVCIVCTFYSPHPKCWSALLIAQSVAGCSQWSELKFAFSTLPSQAICKNKKHTINILMQIISKTLFFAFYVF